MCRKFLPRLVLTFELKGVLYHVMLLFRFLFFFGVRSCEGLYVSLWSYPLTLRAFWYGAMDSSKVSLLDEMVVKRLLMLMDKKKTQTICLMSPWAHTTEQKRVSRRLHAVVDSIQIQK